MQGDELLRRSRFEEAARRYAQARDPEADAVIFRQALLYLSPHSPRYNPAVARQLLTALTVTSSGGPYALLADTLLTMLDSEETLRREVEAGKVQAASCKANRRSEKQACGDSEATLTARIKELSAALEATRAELDKQRVDRAELERLREELSAMKQIDLGER